MVRVWTFTAMVCSLVVGCTATSIEAQQKYGFLRDEATKAPTCSSANECAEKWDRASKWINANSHWRIKEMSDTRIETKKAGAPYYSRPVYLVKKLPRSDGSNLIKLHASCLPSVYCDPDTVIATGSFNHFVNTGEDLYLPNG